MLYTTALTVQSLYIDPGTARVCCFRPVKLVRVQPSLYKCLFHLPKLITKEALERSLALMVHGPIRIEYDIEGLVYSIEDCANAKNAIRFYPRPKRLRGLRRAISEGGFPSLTRST